MNLTPQIRLRCTPNFRYPRLSILLTGLIALAAPAFMMTTAQAGQADMELQLGKMVTRDLKGGQSETHIIRIVAAPQLVRVVIDQKEIDVETSLFGPDGSKVTDIDTNSGKNGAETLWAIAESSGVYRLVVSSPSPAANPGHYEVTLEEMHDVAPVDRIRVFGEWALRDGNLLAGQGEKARDPALAKYKEALKFFDQIPENSSKAEAAFNMGVIHIRKHEERLSFQSLEQALSTYRKLHDQMGEVNVLNLLGQTYQTLGEITNAQKYLEHALQIAKEIQTNQGRLMLATIQANIGNVYAALAMPDQAFNKYREALPVLEAASDHQSVAILHLNIGVYYNDKREPEKALPEFKLAMTVFESLPDSLNKAKLLSSIGYSYFLKGANVQAVELYEKALEMLANLRINGLDEARIINNIAQATSSKETKPATLELYQKALNIYRRLGSKIDEVAALGNIATFHEALGENSAALVSYKTGIEILKRLRESTGIEEIRTSLSESLSPFVFKASMLLMDLGESEEAFNLSEMARARTFLDRLGTVRQDLLKTASPQLINDSRELETKLHSLERRWERWDRDNDVALNAEYAVEQRKYEDLLLRMKVANPGTASSSVKSLTLPEIQRLLDKDTTLLSYFVLPEETFAFVITQHSFQAIKIPLNEAYLNRKITWLRRFASTTVDPSEDLRLLYCWLICPVKPYLKTRTLCIVPHRELDYLPFAALTDGRTYLNDQHTLFYLPSASALSFVHNRKKPAAGPALVLAQSRAVRSPVLEFADQEADMVASLYQTSALKGAKAVKSTFLEQAPRSSIIQIAAHTNLVATSPLFFRIMLAKDRDGTSALQLRDIYNLDLSNASLVVLSACQTNLGGEHSLGDDLEALNRAFLTAGARTVIASMWAVNDEATRDLMKSFYTHLKLGMSKAEALRAAQSETRLKHSHPYYWAGFVLTGDPGKIR